ncbi:hypothetical protein GCM10025868_41290 [Angustibacter aerolatus]|uniref:Uncharacterized protein n=1 Tax=Angustibacter aerolatus TaxID=1162965 RepID=A0ABQ6JP17_9ACTN|nr:hypothetical protein GCM10025868_41290 [Angustibacter aerolatus]
MSTTWASASSGSSTPATQSTTSTGSLASNRLGGGADDDAGRPVGEALAADDLDDHADPLRRNGSGGLVQVAHRAEAVTGSTARPGA